MKDYLSSYDCLFKNEDGVFENNFILARDDQDAAETASEYAQAHGLSLQDVTKVTNYK